jgi:hypothetical protein
MELDILRKFSVDHLHGVGVGLCVLGQRPAAFSRVSAVSSAELAVQTVGQTRFVHSDYIAQE